MIRDRQLHEVTRNSFVTQDRPRIFDRRANVKILRLRIVSWDEKETHRVFVVNAGWIHETAGAGRLKRVRQLPNLKWPEIIGNRDQIVFLEKINHLGLPAFVSFQKRFLVRRNVSRAFRIGIGQLRIGQECFQRAIARVFYSPDHFHFARIERQKQNVFEIVIVVRFAHRREIHHLGHSLLELVGKTMHRRDRGVARLHQLVVLVRRKIDIECHQTFVE